MAGFPKIQNQMLKILFLCHLAFSSLGFLAYGGMIHELVFLMTFLWVLAAPSNSEASSTCCLVSIVCIILDIIIYALFIYWALFGGFRAFISLTCGILNAVLRGLTAFTMFKLWSANSNLAASAQNT